MMAADPKTCGKVRTCPLCGQRFDPEGSSCPSGCPLAGKCKVICCPNCGYEFVEDSAVVSGLGRLWKIIRRRK
jgi:hypothetical protein